MYMTICASIVDFLPFACLQNLTKPFSPSRESHPLSVDLEHPHHARESEDGAKPHMCSHLTIVLIDSVPHYIQALSFLLTQNRHLPIFQLLNSLHRD